tara:strand:- start:3905 stop:4186 length:282 start_codon:yes stop_codon:yes gene_type:complete
MWKSKLKKQVRDLEMDDLSSFVHVMYQLGRWGPEFEVVQNIIYFLEKPYKWNREFRIMQEFAEENNTEWFNLDRLDYKKEMELEERLDDKNRR